MKSLINTAIARARAEEEPACDASAKGGEIIAISQFTPVTTSRVQPLISPAALKLKLPLSRAAIEGIASARARLEERVISGRGAPLAIVGPCSIHCEQAALEYAERLKLLQKRVGDRVQLVMRVYFEKPRTTVGWKGFLYDPNLDGSDNLAHGIERGRALMVKIAEMGVPIATEILDPIAAEYFQDCLSWVAIGARTSESQIHRQLASRLPCPVGFKNGTDGNVEVAACASKSASAQHTHLGIDEYGSVAMLQSPGNAATHIVLRGGIQGPNFDQESVAEATRLLKKLGEKAAVLIDCSHANSEKDYRRQPAVARDVIEQLKSNSKSVMGLMIESHLKSGRQCIDGPLEYGVSVTDGCIDFKSTEVLIEEMAEA